MYALSLPSQLLMSKVLCPFRLDWHHLVCQWPCLVCLLAKDREKGCCDKGRGNSSKSPACLTSSQLLNSPEENIGFRGVGCKHLLQSKCIWVLVTPERSPFWKPGRAAAGIINPIRQLLPIRYRRVIYLRGSCWAGGGYGNIVSSYLRT